MVPRSARQFVFGLADPHCGLLGMTDSLLLIRLRQKPINTPSFGGQSWILPTGRRLTPPWSAGTMSGSGSPGFSPA